jgi:hypothetical protein
MLFRIVASHLLICVSRPNDRSTAHQHWHLTGDSPCSCISTMQFPGYHQMNLLTSLLEQGLEIDNDLIPKRSEKQFLHGPVMLANLNTWSVDMVGPTNFGAKYFVGRARPEEVAWAITCSQVGFVDTGCEKSFKFDKNVVPNDIVEAIVRMNLQRLEDFGQYPEGAPPHPSWPAMHSASSNISLWLAVVAKLTPEQRLEAKKTDLAVAMARTVAGVHYKDDNTAGLNMGQEIVARELPYYLASKYGADPIKVKRKIEALRFDWRLTIEEMVGAISNDCPNGYVWAGEECEPCAKGTLEEGGVCLLCEPGTFGGATGLTACIPCADREIAPAPGGASSCNVCDEGSISVDGVKCEICPAGTGQRFDLNNECVPCYVGLYQPDPGQTFCLQCPRGSVQPSTGQVSCNQCPPNWVQPGSGETECVPCPPGTVEGSRDECVPAL